MILKLFNASKPITNPFSHPTYSYDESEVNWQAKIL